MTIRATCPDCDKRYRVPHDKKEWRCKVCDTVLDMEQEESEEECPQCGTANSAGATFCEDCGAALGDDQGEASQRSSTETRSLAGELYAAHRAIGRLGRVLQFMVIWNALRLLRAAVGLIVARNPMQGDMSLAALEVALVGAELVFLLVVLGQMARRPFPAALTLAVLATLANALIAVILVGLGLETGVLLVVGAMLLVKPAFYWFFVVKAATISRFTREYPDLVESITRRDKPSGKPRSARSRSDIKRDHSLKLGASDEGSALGRSRARIKRESKPPYIAIGVISVAVMGLIGYGLLNRPSSPEAELESIRAAWSEQDFETLSAYVEVDSRERWIRSLERIGEKYEWGEDWPQATEFAYQIDGESLRVELFTEAGAVPFRMRWDDEQGWMLSGMSFKEVKDWKVR